MSSMNNKEKYSYYLYNALVIYTRSNLPTGQLIKQQWKVKRTHDECVKEMINTNVKHRAASFSLAHEVQHPSSISYLKEVCKLFENE